MRLQVQAALAAHGLPGRPLPVSEIVAIALRGNSEKWATHAVDWLESDAQASPELGPLIDEVVGAKRFTQNVRHRLLRVARRA